MGTRTIVLALCLWTATTAHAVGRFTELTDLWWNQNESGWGVNVIHQGDTLFLTFFVYGASRSPTWYIGSDVRFQGATDGVLVFSGPLHETTGPWFFDFFDQASVRYRQVGTVIFRVSGPNSASLVYNVDNFTVSKQLTRYTFRLNEFAGSYVGAVAGSGCPGIVENGTEMTVAQSLASLSVRSIGTQATCNYVGSYAQIGRLGASSGNYTCTNGNSGTYDLTEIEANPNMFSGRLVIRSPACTFTGRLGGLKRD